VPWATAPTGRCVMLSRPEKASGTLAVKLSTVCAALMSPPMLPETPTRRVPLKLNCSGALTRAPNTKMNGLPFVMARSFCLRRSSPCATAASWSLFERIVRQLLAASSSNARATASIHVAEDLSA